MRGERARTRATAESRGGSSPHARGTLGFRQLQRRRQRFIPACAGNARANSRGWNRMPVHPRMRGERELAKDRKHGMVGSSPHARGTLSPVEPCSAECRFIPACAGNAAVLQVSPAEVSVHPRMRGERRDVVLRGLSLGGSSPHARGTPPLPHAQPTQRRFIPACAGNAVPQSKWTLMMPVHPRMRGERISQGIAQVDIGGSSPHARGTLKLLGLERPSCRFIPACAGNAKMKRRGKATRPVHPRMRGERLAVEGRASDETGSSPHARGTHFQ